jgi:hypothetical protein
MHAQGVNPLDLDVADSSEGLVTHRVYGNPFGWCDVGSLVEREVRNKLAKSTKQ